MEKIKKGIELFNSNRRKDFKHTFPGVNAGLQDCCKTAFCCIWFFILNDSIWFSMAAFDFNSIWQERFEHQGLTA